jgi:hypothetical protein
VLDACDLRKGQMAGCFEHGTENFGLIKLGNCLIS